MGSRPKGCETLWKSNHDPIQLQPCLGPKGRPTVNETIQLESPGASHAAWDSMMQSDLIDEMPRGYENTPPRLLDTA